MLFGILLSGAALRLLHYFRRPGLALDEARLSLNIAARGFAGLTAPLEHDQSAPLLFLWAERLATRIFGVNELTLRVLPLLSGVGVLAVSWLIMRRLLSPRAALLGLGILALAPPMVAYSNEVKQYMVEALVAMVLLWLAIEWLDGPSGQAAARLGLGGVVGVWLSGSAVLVLAGMAPILLRPRETRSRPTPAAFAIALSWVVSFAAAYGLVYRAASANPYMKRFWGQAFLIPGPGFVGRSWAAAQEVVWGFIAGHSGWPRKPEADAYVEACAALGFACVVAGLLQFRRSRPSAGALLLGPLGVTFLASALGLYPMSQRLTLFAVPIIVILGVAGLDALVGRWREPWGRGAWWTASCIVVLPLLGVTLIQATAVNGASQMPRLVKGLRAHRAGEPVYVYGRALPAWEFYTTNWSDVDRGRLAFLDRCARSGGQAFENSPSRGTAVEAGEGQGLRYQSVKGEELIGIPTGMEYRALRGLVRHRPDPGWVQREADRIQRAASPGIWVVLTEFFGPEYELIEELRRRGGRITYDLSAPGHVLVRYAFEPPAGDSM